MDKREMFLNNLKKGDMVAIECIQNIGTGMVRREVYYYEYKKIDRITPKRTKFYAEGNEYEPHRIMPITEETDKQNIARSQYITLSGLVDKIKRRKTNYGDADMFEAYNFKPEALESAIEHVAALAGLLGI